MLGINEFNNRLNQTINLPPKLANADEQQLKIYRLYLSVKESLPIHRRLGDTTALEAGIAEYERNMGIGNSEDQ
jgi:hypothetical protein